MAELFIELFGEEIPARMQKAAEARLCDALLAGLAAAGLGGENPQSWSGPRRLAVAISGIAAKEADISEERRGPVPMPRTGSGRISRPQGSAAIRPKSGQRRRAISFCRDRSQGARGNRHSAGNDQHPDRWLHLPKTMRWGTSRKGWVQPLHRITVLFDGKPLAGQVDLGGEMALPFGAETEATACPGVISLSGGASYAAVLEAAHVIADRETRKDMISTGLSAFAGKHSVSVGEDQGLLEEVTGLVEYPHVIMGRIDDDLCSCRVKFWSRRCAATRNISALKNLTACWRLISPRYRI